jgi:hypothetical protein
MALTCWLSLALYGGSRNGCRSITFIALPVSA